jgi:DMSO/TMAO reductase YedYZ molybdopterin-dependent catalytic subunit
VTIDSAVSAAARLAEPGEGISEDELRLAARNHGMPLEVLRYDITPAGLHYLLTHYDIPYLDPAAWTLPIGGRVDRPLTLSLDDLRRRPAVTRRVTLECAGNGRAHISPRPISQPWLDEAVGTAEWTGTPLAPLLREAGLSDGAVEVAFTGADHGVERGVEQDYARALPLDEALRDDVLLVYEMNGHPLPPQHGAPIRLIVPGWYGMTQVKWLVRIDVRTEEFDGFQNAVAYRIKQDADAPGEPVTRILPRALIMPPGFPDFQSRTRVVDRGSHELSGRAWSGWGTITRVELSVDGGASWADADLGEAGDTYAWQAWTWTWDAVAPGRFELRARATDSAGNTQPVDQDWNRQGMANNHAQRVPVMVREGPL